jgi:uracil phosphoribosyltransferase
MRLEEKQKLLTILRDRSLPIETFRKTAEELAQCFARDHQGEKNVILIPILRSGLAMLPPFIKCFPRAPIGFFGMRRDEKTLKPQLYYKNLPAFHSDEKILILDPMIATGGSMSLAIQLLKQEEVLEKQIVAISLIGSKMGVAAVQKRFPSIQIECAAIDEEIDSFGFIVPGLGDFGDRYFGTK